MTRAYGGVAVLAALTLGCLLIGPAQPMRAAPDSPAIAPAPRTSAVEGSAIAALLAANDGKPPATGEQLWKALGKLGDFAQLPVMFSAVHLDSGLANPRVVFTQQIKGLSEADVTEPNLTGRLFLAANMERGVKGEDPRVISVEFISWNTQRRRFDFGVIEDMGGDGEPRLKIVDGGRCFACHKNRGPILGGAPWSNTAHDDIIRLAAAAGHQIGGADLPDSGPFSLPRPAGKRANGQIDGMTLTKPEAASVDFGVRQGAFLPINRDTLRLMTRWPDGRKALVGLLAAVVAPGHLDPEDKATRIAFDNAFEKSYVRFAVDWIDLQKAAKPNILRDVDPTALLVGSGVRPLYRTPAPIVAPVVRVPGLVGGGGSRWAAPPRPRSGGNFQPISRSSAPTGPPPLVPPGVALAVAAARKSAADNQVALNLAATLDELIRYEAARSVGYHGLYSQFQPSNPQAFFKPAVKAPLRPSSLMNAAVLAHTIGLTEGDRKFFATALADAAKRIHQPKATANSLARAVFEGPEFADMMAGGPLPDRDEFKDRFVAGLHTVLVKQYADSQGFTPNRSEYASGPRYDPKFAEEVEAAIVPTTACLRCHDIRPTPGKARFVEPIPALAFDPFDERGRTAWLRTTAKERKREVLARMLDRLAKDADMPPADSPEHDLFRVKEAAAFQDVKNFLEAELEKVRK